MNMPESMRRSIREALWRRLDELDWPSLSDLDHSNYYEQWTRAADIGGKLGHFMDPRAVRVYIKDTLVKDYARERLLSSGSSVLSLLGIPPDSPVAREFIKPHSVLLVDGSLVTWGNSRDWKHLVMAAFERRHLRGGEGATALVIIETGKTADPADRELVRDAAARLGVNPLIWWD